MSLSSVSSSSLSDQLSDSCPSNASSFLFRERRGGVSLFETENATEANPGSTLNNVTPHQQQQKTPLSEKFIHLFSPCFSCRRHLKKKQTVFSLLFHMIPKEFNLPTELEYEYEKSTLGRDRAARVVFLLVFCVAHTASELLAHDYSSDDLWHYFHLGIEWIIVILLVIATFLFPSKLFWQRAISIVAILSQIFSLDSFNSSTMYRPLIIIMVSFTMFPFSSTVLTGFYMILICVLPMVCVLFGIHLYLIVQMWFILVMIVLSGLSFLFHLQRKDRESFLSEYFLNLKKEEAAKEAERMEFLIKQMLPEQMVQRLQDDFSTGKLDNTTPNHPGTLKKAVHSTNNLLLSRYKYNQSGQASIAFIRIKDFNSVFKSMTASETFIVLSDIFSLFDQVVEDHNLYRFKTVGQSYMFGGGSAFSSKQNHLQAVFEASQQIILSLKSLKYSLCVQIGIASGAVVCGVVGDLHSTRIHFDAWGNAVTLASRLTTFDSKMTSASHGNYIHVESKYETLLDLAACHVEQEDHVKLKGRRDSLQILRIFPIDPSSVNLEASQNTPPPTKNAWSEARSDFANRKLELFNMHYSSTSNFMQQAMSGHSDAHSAQAFSKHRVQKSNPFLYESSAEFMKTIADNLPEYVTNSSGKLFSKVLPAIQFPFRNWKLYRLYLQDRFKTHVGAARSIVLQCIILYCLGGVGDCLTMLLYADREKLGPTLRAVFSEYDLFSAISWNTIGLWRYAVGLPVIFLSSVWVFTPLYSYTFKTYNLLTLFSAIGILIAHAIKCYQLGSNLVDQFILLLFTVSFSNVQMFAIFFKLVFFIVVGATFTWQNLVSLYEITNVGYITSAALLMVLVLIMCVHNSFYTHMNTIHHLLMLALQTRETEELRTRKDVSSMVARSVLPPALVEKLQPNRQQHTLADYVESLSVCYADIVNFSVWSANLLPEQLVQKLDHLFSNISSLAQNRNLNRLHIVGDNIIVVGGCPTWLPEHQLVMVQYAFALLEFVKQFGEVEFRVGIHCGAALSGCLATSRVQWDILGSTMIIGELMERTGEAMRIHISKSVHIALCHNEGLSFEECPRLIEDPCLESPMQTYFVTEKEEENFPNENKQDVELSTPNDMGEDLSSVIVEIKLD